MERFDWVFALLWLSAVIMWVGGFWYFVTSWRKYRFSAGWWLVAIVLTLAPPLLFPLSSMLCRSAAVRQNRPEAERKRTRLYVWLSWGLVVGFAVTDAIARAVLALVAPDAANLTNVAMILTVWTVTVATVACLWILRRLSR